MAESNYRYKFLFLFGFSSRTVRYLVLYASSHDNIFNSSLCQDRIGKAIY